MRKLPKARILRVPANQKRALARWLSEWRIDKMLREDDRSPSASGSRDPETAYKSSGPLYDMKSAAVGQIRLLHPVSHETAKRPRYIAVLKDNGDGSWLVAPFGRFSEPAVPGEWKTGRNIPVLRTLCIWNAQRLSDTVLARSWVVDRMTASRVAQAVTIHGFLAESRQHPRAISLRVGPPLSHPLDPRVEYLEEEREWFATLPAKQHSAKPEISPYAKAEDSAHSLLLAAEKREEYKPAKTRSGKHRGTDGDHTKRK